MAGSIYLRKARAELSRFDISKLALDRLLGGYEKTFMPTSIEAWQDAPSKSMGGTPLSSHDVSDRTSLINMFNQIYSGLTQEVRAHLIMKVSGLWTAQSEDHLGYININFEPAFSSVYGDIELGMYPTRNYTDLIDLFWSSQKTREQHVDSLIGHISRFNSHEQVFDRVYFAEGTPSPSYWDLLTAAYYRNVKYMFSDAVQTAERIFEVKISRHIAPYKWSTVLDILHSSPSSRERFDVGLNFYGIIAMEGNSVSLIAKSKESFRNALSKLSQAVLVPALTSLQKKADLKARVEHRIKETPFDL